jgi:hypothetical protein
MGSVIACGGATHDGTGTGQSSGSCVQLDGTRRDDGTRIECSCMSGATGTVVCENGEWSSCSCESGSGGGAAAVCGNGIIESGEVCDGTSLGGESCSSVTMHALPSGVLRCTVTCTFDTSQCSGGTGGSGIGGMGFGGAIGTGGVPGDIDASTGPVPDGSVGGRGPAEAGPGASDATDAVATD